MAIQIGKYKRPGIFIEEYDQSIISASPAVDGLNTLVVGFSKKGPYNTPIRLTNTNDLESIFGSLDRGLERKGSFFHRTITKMLESSAVYALNLLATDDNLDKLQYRSLSAATGKSNGSLLEDSYRKFFNTTGFWKKDTDAFISLTKDDDSYNDTVINLTNFSDRPISVFMFKSKLTGFDRTLIEWYGTAEKVPPYLNVNEYASDYLVDCIVVGGDWSNYQVLSVDPRWSRYFDSTGLKKTMLSEFAYDRNVNLLAYYEGLSLIPYFRDGNGKNIFIETIINRDTDKTGLFCSFNIDLFETDYPMGMVDLLGNNLVNNEQASIDFLSYKDTIIDSSAYSDVVLDRPGNVWGILDKEYVIGNASDITYFDSFRNVDSNRTANFSEGYVSGVLWNSTIKITSSSVSIFIEKTDATPYAIIGGNMVDINFGSLGVGDTLEFQITSTASYEANESYISTVVLRSTGDIELINGTIPVSSGISAYPSVSANDIVLGFIQINIDGTISIDTVDSPDPSGGEFGIVTIDSNGFFELPFTMDYEVLGYGDVTYDPYTSEEVVSDSTGPDSLTVVFYDTADTPNVRNYLQYRKLKYFNYIVNLLNSSSKRRMTMIVNEEWASNISEPSAPPSFRKRSCTDMVISDVVTSTTRNKRFTISNLGFTDATLSDIYQYGMLVFYTIDDEFIMGSEGFVTKDTLAVPETSAEGVAAKYSKFYLDYLNGNINNNDYFYTNYINPSDDEFFVTFQTLGATAYVIFETTSGNATSNWPSVGVNSGDNMKFPGSTLNNKVLTILDYNNQADVFGGSASDGMYAFSLSQTVNDELLKGVTTVYNVDKKHYLKMYLDDSDNLECTLVTNAGDPYPLESVNTQYGFDVFSDKLNYRQTLEIVFPAGYTPVPNKILCNADRYTEVKIGDFLEAYVDETSLQPGEVPRKLTRILSKKFYPADTTLVELSCDSRIAYYNVGTLANPDYQTTRYTTVEDYISTYKAITLKGFKIRQASIPDGTETRQQEILNLVAKGTPMFNALVNKEAIDFRYIVDSFGLGLIEKSKQQLVDIAGDRLDCFAFISMPSMKDFKNSGNPSFTNSDGVLDTSFIAAGADLENNPLFLYSFGDGRGTTCAGYFLPYLEVSDNGRPLMLPPAMFAATTYLKKFNSNITSIVPWTIAAGVTNGKVTGFNKVEMDFTLTDIENLNQAQMNPIVFKRNRGFIIETENTAQTLYRSALSYIHVREVLIELERELSRMLLDFQWKFNTSDVRAEIKLRADVICEKYVSRNGLYNYFNKCDDENNTPDIIDNQIGVLDTYVEPIKGMGIIVNNITILRTGAIQSGGFIVS